jgi:hypothetical protein
MRFFVYLIVFLSVLTGFVSGVAFLMFMADGLLAVALFVAALVLACFTAILGSAVYWRMEK